MRIFNEENKNEIKNENKFNSLKSKLDYKNLLNNQNKINNIFKRKSGNKIMIKNLIFQERKNTSKSIRIINNNKKIYIKSS